MLLKPRYGTYQLFHADNIPNDGVAPNRFYYTIDTSGGQSGAPVWIELGDDKRRVVGIHTYGFRGVRGRNSATRITPMIFKSGLQVFNGLIFYSGVWSPNPLQFQDLRSKALHGKYLINISNIYITISVLG